MHCHLQGESDGGDHDDADIDEDVVDADYIDKDDAHWVSQWTQPLSSSQVSWLTLASFLTSEMTGSRGKALSTASSRKSGKEESPKKPKRKAKSRMRPKTWWWWWWWRWWRWQIHQAGEDRGEVRCRRRWKEHSWPSLLPPATSDQIISSLGKYQIHLGNTMSAISGHKWHDYNLGWVAKAI